MILGLSDILGMDFSALMQESAATVNKPSRRPLRERWSAASLLSACGISGRFAGPALASMAESVCATTKGQQSRFEFANGTAAMNISKIRQLANRQTLFQVKHGYAFSARDDLKIRRKLCNLSDDVSCLILTYRF